MIKRYKKLIAVCVTMAFMTLLPVYAMPLPAGKALNRDEDAAQHAEQTQNFIEIERQVGYQASSKNIIPVLLVIAAVTAGVFLLVILLNKSKYDITGDWEFHIDYTTEGYADFDSVWTFTAYNSSNKMLGTYSKNVGGTTVKGTYYVVNKNEVLFQDYLMTEQYEGKFDSITTMSGTFFELDSDAEGNWTATKK